MVARALKREQRVQSRPFFLAYLMFREGMPVADAATINFEFIVAVFRRALGTLLATLTYPFMQNVRGGQK